MYRFLILVGGIMAWSHSIALGQNFSHGFNFYLPPDDTTGQSYLPQFPRAPINVQDFVTIDSEGHFSVAGHRVRFFGVNAVAAGAFPTRSKAGFIAGRLRKMGFNLVRFHHMDNPWSRESLFEWGKDTRHLNPETLDRLEKFIAQLKRNGIYANINLHVSRTFQKSDGVADADSILDFGKGVTCFDPYLIQLQKEYAAQLLLHVNPYTGLPLVDDPVMAMVEVTNENSLYRMWRQNKLKPFRQGGSLTLRHSRMLDSLWLDYLRYKYVSTTALAQAWNIGEKVSPGPDQIRGGGFETDPLLSQWTLELHSPAVGMMNVDASQPFAGKIAARVLITQSDGINWHAQWKYRGITLEKDSLYAVRFAARADHTREIVVSVMRDVNPWTVFYSTSFLLTEEWQELQFSFRARETVSSTARLSFHLGGEIRTCWFDEIHFESGIILGLLPGESLEKGSVHRLDYSRANSFTDARVADMSNFYFLLQSSYFDQMHRYLVHDLGVKVPIVGTNWNVGPPDLYSQSQMDYLDVHAYWDHPQFPGEPWSPVNWLINNTPMVLDEYGGTIPNLFAGVGFSGKPLTVSEYNHPFPNRFQTEGVLFLTGYASFHDADAVMFFDYNNSTDDWETDKIKNYFSIHRNSAMMALMPSCAFAFRNFLVTSARETILLRYSMNQLLLAPKFDNLDWRGIYLFPTKFALQHAIRNASFHAPVDLSQQNFAPEPTAPYQTDTGELGWNPRGLFSIVTPRFIGVTGFLQQFLPIPLAQHSLIESSGFATFTWISLTGDSLPQTARSLLTLTSRIQNTGMVWDGTQTIHQNWGRPPTQLEPARVKLRLQIQADSIRIYPLRSTGAKRSFTTYLPEASNRFTFELDQNNNHTLWFGLEAFGKGQTPVSEKQEAWPRDFTLAQNSPNPFPLLLDGATRISFELPGLADVTLLIYDLLGRSVFKQQRKRLSPGWHSFVWNGTNLQHRLVESGVYFYRLTVEHAPFKSTKTKKIVVIR